MWLWCCQRMRIIYKGMEEDVMIVMISLFISLYAVLLGAESLRRILVVETVESWFCPLGETFGDQCFYSGTMPLD